MLAEGSIVHYHGNPSGLSLGGRLWIDYPVLHPDVLDTHFDGLIDHRLVRYRRVPAHDEAVAVGEPIAEVESWDLCFFADTVCDDVIDVMDAQRILNRLRATQGRPIRYRRMSRLMPLSHTG